MTKVTEVMACGTMLVTPRIDHASGRANMLQFEDGKHLVYYDQDKPRELYALLDYYLHHPSELDAIATAGCTEVQRAHTLTHRVDRMVSDALCFVERRAASPHTVTAI